MIFCDNNPPLPRSTIDPTDQNDSCSYGVCREDGSCSVVDADIFSSGDFDILSSGWPTALAYEDFFPIHLHATWQAYAGWLTEAQILTPDVSGEYWLTTLESLTPTPKAIKILLGMDQRGLPQYYWLQTREFSSSCRIDVRLEARSIFYSGGEAADWFSQELGNTYFFYNTWFRPMPGAAQEPGVSDASIIRLEKPFWDLYRGVRMEMLDCVEEETGAAVKVRVEFTHLDVNTPIVAAFHGASTAQTITLTNNDSVPIEVGSASIGGRHPNAFVIDSNTCSAGILEAGAFCEITVSHIPNAYQDDNPNNHAVLKIPNSDALAPELAVSLFGER